MAFKNPVQLAKSLENKPSFVFDYPDSLEEINGVLDPKNQAGYSTFDDIELGDGYTLTPNKRIVYGDDQDYNIEFDVFDENKDIIDTLGVYGLDFDEDYQSQLQEIIRNHKMQGGR